MGDLRRRLEKLESAAARPMRTGLSAKSATCRNCRRTYTGEKHIAAVHRFANGWYEWEERRGPDPKPAAGDATFLRVLFVSAVPYRIGDALSKHGPYVE